MQKKERRDGYFLARRDFLSGKRTPGLTFSVQLKKNGRRCIRRLSPKLDWLDVAGKQQATVACTNQSRQWRKPRAGKTTPPQISSWVTCCCCCCCSSLKRSTAPKKCWFCTQPICSVKSTTTQSINLFQASRSLATAIIKKEIRATEATVSSLR